MPGTSSTPAPAGPAFPVINGEHWIEALHDGSHVLIRPIRPEDGERESDFIARLSPEARYYRFLGEVSPSDKALIDQMTHVDGHASMAFVALAHDNGVLREVGVSRYAAADEAKRCECAVTVADDWQHRGLAVALMRHLIDVARRNGFRQMFSIDASSNESMRELARHLGFACAPYPDDATLVVHKLDL